MVDKRTSAASRKLAVTEDDVLKAARGESALQCETAQRTRALEYYLNAPVPDRVRHLWRYSEPELFFPQSAPRASEDAKAAPTVVASEPEFEEKGVTCVPLHTSKRGLSLIGQAVPLNHGLFEALCGALWTKGIYIRVPRNVVLENPIQIVHSAAGEASLARTVVELEPGASAEVLEIFEGGGEDSRVISVSELLVAPGAFLHHATVQKWREKTRGLVTVRAAVAGDAVFKETSFALGGAVYKCDLGAELSGVGAQSEIAGVSFATQDQHMDFHTVQHHRARKTGSQIRFKSALSRAAVSVYTGLIRIEEDARGSEAFQESRSLMLSDKAKAKAIPELEIMTDEVQCSHAAAVAPLSDSELFYLMSRGISPPMAKRILAGGFFSEVLSKIPGTLKERVSSALEERLTQALQEEEDNS